MGLISPDQGDPDFKWETNPMIEGREVAPAAPLLCWVSELRNQRNTELDNRGTV